MLFLLSFLALGAAAATLIENDFGTASARMYVYNTWWYEALLAATCLNLALVLARTRMYLLHRAKFIFHVALIVIALGAGLTRYFGVEGVMKIRENATVDFIVSNEKSDIIQLPFALKLNDFVLER